MAKPVATLAALEGICCLGRETAIAATFFGRRAGAKQFLSEWNGGICQNEKPALSQLPVMFEEIGWGARIRTWEWRNQNPLPYRLATPQWPEGAQSTQDRAYCNAGMAASKAACRGRTRLLGSSRLPGLKGSGIAFLTGGGA